MTHLTPVAPKKIIPGKTYNLSGDDYVVPPLTARGLKEAQALNLDAFIKLRPLLENLEATNKALQEETGDGAIAAIQQSLEHAKTAQNIEFDTACSTAYAAFKRNYPEVSYDAFLDLVTSSQVKEMAVWAMAGEDSPKKD